MGSVPVVGELVVAGEQRGRQGLGECQVAGIVRRVIVGELPYAVREPDELVAGDGEREVVGSRLLGGPGPSFRLSVSPLRTDRTSTSSSSSIMRSTIQSKAG